jgi:hypothetical protein
MYFVHLYWHFTETLPDIQYTYIIYWNYPKHFVCSYVSELRSLVIGSAQDRSMNPSTCFIEHISMVTKSTIELRLLGSEGINNHRLLHFLLRTALQYPLACYKLLCFLLTTASFHLHPRVTTFSTLKVYMEQNVIKESHY